MTKTEKLTMMAPNGFCEFGSFSHESRGEIIHTYGWHWRQTPSGQPYGASFPAKFIGSNFAEAEEYFENQIEA